MTAIFTPIHPAIIAICNDRGFEIEPSITKPNTHFNVWKVNPHHPDYGKRHPEDSHRFDSLIVYDQPNNDLTKFLDDWVEDIEDGVKEDCRY